MDKINLASLGWSMLLAGGGSFYLLRHAGPVAELGGGVLGLLGIAVMAVGVLQERKRRAATVSPATGSCSMTMPTLCDPSASSACWDARSRRTLFIFAS